MSQSADLGYTIGLAESKTKDEAGKTATRHSKYLTAWNKQDDGSWKFAIDGGNSSPPGEN
jgi:ketosteroid isomerase-like protein